MRADDAARKAADAAPAALVEAEAAADRARVVARLSQELLPAETLLDVLRASTGSSARRSAPTVPLLGLADTGCADLRVWALAAGAAPFARAGARAAAGRPHPLAVAARERRLVPVATRRGGEP